MKPAGIFGDGIGFQDGDPDGVDLVWYFLFIVFVTYAMLPLPLRTCMVLGCTTALFHVLYTSLRHIATSQVQYLPVVSGQLLPSGDRAPCPRDWGTNCHCCVVRGSGAHALGPRG